jgi:hypothetical protein
VVLQSPSVGSVATSTSGAESFANVAKKLRMLPAVIRGFEAARSFMPAKPIAWAHVVSERADAYKISTSVCHSRASLMFLDMRTSASKTFACPRPVS